MMGWHFTDEFEELRFGDGRKIKVGITHTVDCEPILCQQGLHASKTVFDALREAPGTILHRVRLEGKIVHGKDKSAATSRTYLARIDAGPILKEWKKRWWVAQSQSAAAGWAFRKNQAAIMEKMVMDAMKQKAHA